MNPQPKVIGPIKQEDWNTMVAVLSSCQFYFKNNQTGKYNKAIEREWPIYEEFKKLYHIGVQANDNEEIVSQRSTAA